ncbi:MAG: NAD-glutamate dehydrogenase, partial [Gammaproteobacteria bacterium]|nr:NAD-glutamate dehydrogenase [Gammaproteobacteria bacterium]
DGLITHYLNNVVFAVDRDNQGRVTRTTLERDHATRELLIYAEIDRVDEEDARTLKKRLEQTVVELTAIVNDFHPMKDKLHAHIRELHEATLPVPDEEAGEAIAFLEWLVANNFTFLGYREFTYIDDMMHQTGGSLGALRVRSPASERRLSDQPENTREFLLSPSLLSFSKSGTKSGVHRHAYPDYIGIRRFDSDGKVVGECGFLGLYTSRVYMESPNNIPVVRSKVANVIGRSDLDPNGFDGKVLAQVLEVYPRDELFQIDEDELLENALAITYIHERRRTRVFTRFDGYGLFVNCLVYLPRNLFNTQSRLRIQNLLMETFDADDAEFDPHFSESILVRLQFILRIRPGSRPQVDIRALERKVIEITGDWVSDFHLSAVGHFGEARGRLILREYSDGFPAGYQENVSAADAVEDVASIEQLSVERNLLTRFYRHAQDPEKMLHLKVFHLGEPLPLSDIIPELENMGLRVNGEHPYRIARASGPLVSILDFHLTYNEKIDFADVGERFEESFVRTWNGDIENDGYNRLILGAGLDWRQVNVLRTYAKYMKQIRFGFSQNFIGDTLDVHRTIAADLTHFFEQRFDPQGEGDQAALSERIVAAIENVELLNEDRILRKFLELMQATQRTNYYLRETDGAVKPYLAMKLKLAQISDMPLPRPMVEIFVCAPYFEGLHLRRGAIARGGLRWSDRLEDYRTEVLGLMKAQVVKNAVIVPTGAKGGFVLKTSQGAVTQDVSKCYRDFIRGLLDITDNIVNGQVVTPENVRRYDGDDPYLVVAADKGTATFSDEANTVAEQYGFWLGDAFASGGSNGYDHKKMGITAKGAWISVQQHFAEREIDVQREPVSVIGIGDMAGDVFGNGMLQSKYLGLIAAFNHLHIFIDPNPDPVKGYAERKRLFALPRSSWEDYDVLLISAGGGVFSRQAKSVKITPEMASVFGIDAERLSPDELIHALLKAPVQLIWNGGIGTYVKAQGENHADVGDRANDHLRVNAEELNCQVFGEGGNLGMTQKARISFDQLGGSVNTDFIDNSAGVDCSDHEVNIKIALNEIVASGEITVEQRNTQLTSMTDEVSTLVLTNNRRQVQTLSLAHRHSRSRQGEYRRFLHYMETDHNLDRGLEHLPQDDELAERFGRGGGFARPELAVLLAFAKTHIKMHLVSSSIHEDPEIFREVLSAFPPTLAAQHTDALLNHRLAKEIVATQLANDIVDHMGVTFVVHLMGFVGGSVDEIVRSYYVAAKCFGIREKYRSIEQLDNVAADVKLGMLLELIRLGRRATRWIFRHRRSADHVVRLVDEFQAKIQSLDAYRGHLMGRARAERWERRVQYLIDSAGVPEPLARNAANAADMATALPVIDAADRTGTDPVAVAQAYAMLGEELSLDWLTEHLGNLPSNNQWQAMERDSLLDDVTTHQGVIAARSLYADGSDVVIWLAEHEGFVASWRGVIEEAQQAAVQDFSMFSIACRKLNDLCLRL